MSILGNIFSRILPHAHASQPANPAQPAATQAAPPRAVTPAAPQATQPQQPASAGSAAAAPVASAGTATLERVDVEQVLDGLAAHNPQKLNWRSSIVDLMKLVGMESTLQERRELAQELGYSGDQHDSAAMNTWLHKAVMRKLEENGGKVPDNLKD